MKEARKVSSKSLVSNDQTFYKMSRPKKKFDIVLTVDPKFKTNNNWPFASQYEKKVEEEGESENPTKIKEINMRTVSREIQRKSTENVVKFSKIASKRPEFDTQQSKRKYQSVRNQLKKVCDK